MRRKFGRILGYTRKDREEHLHRLGMIARNFTQNGVVCLVAAIAPYALAREQNRALVGNYVEVFCNCSLDAIIVRDTKGLYRKALAGEVLNLTAISDPYDLPVAPEIEVRTDVESVDQSLYQIFGYLHDRGLLPGQSQIHPDPEKSFYDAGVLHT